MKLILDIKMLEYEDLNEITAIHQSAFPESMLNKLGSKAIFRFYKSIFEGPHDIVPLGAWLEEKLIGYSFAGIWDQVERRFVKANLLFLTALVCFRPWLIVYFNFRNRLKLGLRLLKQPKVLTRQKPTLYEKMFGIQSIAVIPKLQGYGIGKRLMVETEKAALKRGHNLIMLTVHNDNLQAIRFYEKMGWEKRQDGKNWEGVMVKRLYE